MGLNLIRCYKAAVRRSTEQMEGRRCDGVIRLGQRMVGPERAEELGYNEALQTIDSLNFQNGLRGRWAGWLAALMGTDQLYSIIYFLL